MPETPITREQLLASVHTLQEGDLLVLRAPDGTPPDHLKTMMDVVSTKLPEGVTALVMTDQLAIEVVRSGDKAANIAEAVARATANPGHVVEVAG